MQRLIRYGRTAVLLVGVAAMAGCDVSRRQRADGSERVEVQTPVGSLRVKTSEKPAGSGVGLSVYPGATAVERRDGEGGGADVDLTLGSMQVRVRTLSYRTDDSAAEVEQFYRKALAGYGAVIACRNNQPVGEPRRTPEGLTCGDEGENGAGDDKQALELRVGSPAHRHVVVLTPDGAGTRFVLIVLDLPRALLDDAKE